MKNINCKCINQYHCCTKKPKTFFIFYRSCCEFYGEKCDIAERWEKPKGPPPSPPIPRTAAEISARSAAQKTKHADCLMRRPKPIISWEEWDKIKCQILGHKLGWEIFDPRPCKRTGCDHVEPARERPPCPPSPSEVQNLKNNLSKIKATFEDLTALMVWSLNDPDKKRTLPYPMIGKNYATGPGSNIGVLIRHFAYHIGMDLTVRLGEILKDFEKQ